MSYVTVTTDPFPVMPVVTNAATLDANPIPIIPIPSTIPVVSESFNVVS